MLSICCIFFQTGATLRLVLPTTAATTAATAAATTAACSIRDRPGPKQSQRRKRWECLHPHRLPNQLR